MKNKNAQFNLSWVVGILFCANSFGGTQVTVTGSAGVSDLNTGYRCHYSRTWNDSDEAAQEAIANAKEQCQSEVKRTSPWTLVRVSCHEWGNYTLSAEFQCFDETSGLLN